MDDTWIYVISFIAAAILFAIFMKRRNPKSAPTQPDALEKVRRRLTTRDGVLLFRNQSPEIDLSLNPSNPQISAPSRPVELKRVSPFLKQQLAS